MGLTLWFALVSAALSADPGLRIAAAAGSLTAGDTAPFLALFDPGMPGLAQWKARLSDPATEVQLPAIEFLRPDGGAGTLAMNWQVRIVQQQGSPATTTRTRRVTCRFAAKDGQWRIAGIEPLDVLTPPDVGGAFALLQSAASALVEPQPETRLPIFLASLDPAMPGFGRLRENVGGWVVRGDVHSSIDLVSNEGDDLTRTITVDWTLNIVVPETGIQRFERSRRVVCRVARHGRHWKIEGIDPLDFFAPPDAIE